MDLEAHAFRLYEPVTRATESKACRVCLHCCGCCCWVTALALCALTIFLHSSYDNNMGCLSLASLPKLDTIAINETYLQKDVVLYILPTWNATCSLQAFPEDNSTDTADTIEWDFLYAESQFVAQMDLEVMKKHNFSRQLLTLSMQPHSSTISSDLGNLLNFFFVSLRYTAAAYSLTRFCCPECG